MRHVLPPFVCGALAVAVSASAADAALTVGLAAGVAVGALAMWAARVATHSRRAAVGLALVALVCMIATTVAAGPAGLVAMGVGSALQVWLQVLGGVQWPTQLFPDRGYDSRGMQLYLVAGGLGAIAAASLIVLAGLSDEATAGVFFAGLSFAWAWVSRGRSARLAGLGLAVAAVLVVGMLSESIPGADGRQYLALVLLGVGSQALFLPGQGRGTYSSAR